MNSDLNGESHSATYRQRIKQELSNLTANIPPTYIYTPGFSGYLATLNQKSPGAMLVELMAMARANPLQTARLLLAADRLPDPVWLMGVSITYLVWGRHARAAEVLAHTPDDQLDGPAKVVRHWARVLANRAIETRPRSVGTLFEIADELDTAGYSRAARQCRIDAYGGILPGTMTGQQSAQLSALLETIETHDPPADCIYARAVTALLWAGQNQLDQAEPLLESAADLLDPHRMPALAVYLQYLDLALAWHQRRLTRMRAIGRDIRKLSQQINHPYYALRSDHLLGQAYFEAGDYEDALIVMMRAHHTAGVLMLPFFRTATLLDMGSVLLQQENYSTAAHYFAQAEVQAEAQGLHLLKATARMNRGVAALRMGYYAEALSHLRAVLPLFEEANAPEYLALALDNLASIYMTLGYLDPARDYYQTAYRALHDARLTQQAIRPALHMAWNALVTGEIGQAHDRLLALRQRIEVSDVAQHLAEYAVLWAELLLAQGDTSGAQTAFEAAASTARSLNMTAFAVRAELGLLEVAVREGAGHPGFRAWTDTEIDELELPFQWKALALRAQVYLSRDDAGAALRDYRASLDRINRARRSVDDEMFSGYLAQATQQVYEAAYLLAFQQANPMAALDIADRYSAQVLAARSQHTNDLLTGGVNDLLRRLRRCMKQRYGSKWVVLRYVVQEIEEVRQASVFQLSAEGMTHIPLPEHPEARMALRMLTGLDDSFRRIGYGTEQRTMRQQAFRALLPPGILDHLHQDGLLVIIPSGYLHSMAFASLISPGGRSLVEYTDVLYAYSVSGLVHTLEQKPVQWTGKEPGLILSQSQFEKQGYPPLPFVQHEVNHIAKLHRTEIIHTDTLRTEDLRRQGRGGDFADHQWLHIASHAHADPSTGAFDGILLGDDVLFLDDIRACRIKAQRVTLSACQTGLGYYYYGDELAGLLQSFLGLGVSSVVGSLWHTSDVLSASLMGFYYEKLAEGASTAEALSAAQRRADADGIPPYYWAAFIASGMP